MIYYAPRDTIYYDHRGRFLREAVETAGAAALPVIPAAIEAGSPPEGPQKRSRQEDPNGRYYMEWDPDLGVNAIEALIGLNDPRFDDLILAELRRGTGRRKGAGTVLNRRVREAGRELEATNLRRGSARTVPERVE